MLITRYLAKNLVLLTTFVAVTLTAVIWLTQSMKILELVANSDAPTSLFLKLVLLSLPQFLEIILPLSLAAAVMFAYNRLLSDNELVVMRACGVDHIGLAKPALIIAAGMTAVLLAFTTYISPKSTAELSFLRQTIKAQYSAFLLREGVFNTFGSDLTVYLRRRDDSGALYGLVIQDARDRKNPPVTFIAKKGRIALVNGVPTIQITDGMRQQMDPRSNVVGKLYFSKYAIEIKSLESGAGPLWRDADERTLAELIRPDLSDPRDQARRVVFLAKITDRLVTPFNAASFTFIALTALLLGPFNRRGQSKKIAIAAMAVFLAQALNLALVNLMKKNIAFAPGLYIVTFLPLFAGPWLLRERGERFVMDFVRRHRAPEEREA
jgi:lipopolysaccharide export system permease protein